MHSSHKNIVQKLSDKTSMPLAPDFSQEVINKKNSATTRRHTSIEFGALGCND